MCMNTNVYLIENVSILKILLLRLKMIAAITV